MAPFHSFPLRALALAALLGGPLLPSARAQDLTRADEKAFAPAAPKPDAPPFPGWSLHAQNTVIVQSAPGFDSPYRGQNSLTGNQTRETITVTLFLARQLWKGAAIVFDPEFAQGEGLNKTHGVAGFPNGEATKAGSLRGKLDLERLFLSQVIGFGGEREDVTDAFNRVAVSEDVSRLTLVAGKFAASDYFDDNSLSHDPRTQFLNWTLWESAAWDYPADSKGYTYGLVLDFNQKQWAVRYGALALPRVSNGLAEASNIAQELGHVGEFEGRYTLFGGQGGKVRVLAFGNRAHMGAYREAVNEVRGNPALGAADITRSRAYRWKYGGAVNFEQALGDDLGAFLRLSINDGATETWAFTEVDRSAALGLSLKGKRWGRPEDTVGLAGVVNGLSVDHRDYLAAGGTGALLGDGRLNYAPEEIIELYYDALLTPKDFKYGKANLALDYQFINDPGYNADRGPANVLSARLHLEY